MAKFAYPPEPWRLKNLKSLGVRGGNRYIKAVPILILEEWERKERKKGDTFFVENDNIAERLESSGLHDRWKGKDKSNIVAPLTTIQKNHNLTPFLIEKVGKGFSKFNLPYYEPLLQDYRQYYSETYPEDYRKLYPDEKRVGKPNDISEVVEVKNDEIRPKPLGILQVLEEYDRTWRKRLDEAEFKIRELTEIAEKVLPPEETRMRQRIPRDVRIEVWKRDGGQCAKCGNREKLEYDHIVPISKGGSNTTRNIELLCEKCNRRKGNNIG